MSRATKMRYTPWRETLLAVGFVGLLVFVCGVVLVSLGLGMSEDEYSHLCLNHLKQWGVVVRMYAAENKGAYPPPDRLGSSGTPLRLAIDPDPVLGDYGHQALFVCPTRISASDRKAMTENNALDLVGNDFFAYVPWAVRSPLAYVDESGNLPPQPDWTGLTRELARVLISADYQRALVYSGPYGSDTAAEALATPLAQPAVTARYQLPESDEILLMFERVGPWHTVELPHAAGINVLFLDGHADRFQLQDPRAPGLVSGFIPALLRAEEAAAKHVERK